MRYSQMSIYAELPQKRVSVRSYLKPWRTLRSSLPAKPPRKGEVPSHPPHPGDNPGANRWFRESIPIQIQPPGGSICGRSTSDLPLGCLCPWEPRQPRGKSAPGLRWLPLDCTLRVNHPGVKLRATLKSISHRCHLFEVAFVWQLIKETMHLPVGCFQDGPPMD